MPETFAVLALVAVATAGTAAITQVSEKIPTGFCRSATFGDAPCRTGALVRAVGTFANPSLLAAFLLLFAPFAMMALAMLPDRARVAVTTVVVMGYAASSPTVPYRHPSPPAGAWAVDESLTPRRRSEHSAVREPWRQ